jgi:ParB-like nuclease domain
MRKQTQRFEKEHHPVTGFSRGYAYLPVQDMPIASIDEPSPNKVEHSLVREYSERFKQGEIADPIELIDISASYPGETPFEIYNGRHRYCAAVLAGHKTIRAVIVAYETATHFVLKPARNTETTE